MVSKEIVKFVQHELVKRGAQITADGIIGPKTIAAIQIVETIPTHWEDDRQVIGFVQWVCIKNSINAGPIDGFMGPQTEYGFLVVKALVEGKTVDDFRVEEGSGEGTVVGGNDWPLQTTSELTAFYGDVGTNQTRASCSYPLKIAWAPAKKIHTFSCHEKVKDSIEKVLSDVHQYYGIEKIVELGLDMWGGCLNVRKMRGSSNWSTHSWGIAIDFFPQQNKLRWDYTRAAFAKPVYDKWWEFWENEGWVSLGRERDFDWMHVMAAKIRKR